jgi:hypothetical protein
VADCDVNHCKILFEVNRSIPWVTGQQKLASGINDYVGDSYAGTFNYLRDHGKIPGPGLFEMKVDYGCINVVKPEQNANEVAQYGARCLQKSEIVAKPGVSASELRAEWQNITRFNRARKPAIILLSVLVLELLFQLLVRGRFREAGHSFAYLSLVAAYGLGFIQPFREYDDGLTLLTVMSVLFYVYSERLRTARQAGP